MDDSVTSQKQSQLRALAAVRRSAQWEGYKNIGDYHGGRYDCDFVSPYTKSASDVDSPLLIMLQDWASDDFLSGPFCEKTQEFGRTPTRATNVHLDALVSKYFCLSICETFATNLFPFIKPRKMNAKIPTKDLVTAAKEYALPQIEIVAPRLVAALGLNCFNSLRRALGLEQCATVASAITQPFTFGSSMIWCQAHTSPLGQNTRNRGGVDRVHGDWKAMSDWYRARLNPPKEPNHAPA